MLNHSGRKRNLFFCAIEQELKTREALPRKQKQKLQEQKEKKKKRKPIANPKHQWSRKQKDKKSPD